MVRRIAFLSGLILGSGICAWALGSALIYLFTGKFPSVQVGGERRLRLELTDVHSMYEAPVVASRPVVAQHPVRIRAGGAGAPGGVAQHPAPGGVVQDMEGV